MSPIPYVRGQVVALAILIAGTAAFDAANIATYCGIVGLVWLLALREKYHWDLIRAGMTFVPSHRARLDRVVARDALVTLLPMTLFAALFATAIVHPLTGYNAIHGATVALAPAAVIVWGSSLVDWYVILPRISGQLGHRPCRAGEEEEPFTFPWTWKEVTRWWYIHRVVGTLAFRLGLSAAIAAVLTAVTGLELVAHAAAWIVMLTFGAYAVTALVRGSILAKQVGQGGHVKGIIGQTVTVERREGRRPWWRLWRKLKPLHLNGRHYVVDVALEGIQLAAVEPREATKLPAPLSFEKDFDSVPIAEANAIRQEPSKFSGCAGRCSGINWYCIENPRCFRPK
jgi:hypothetical protein